MILPSFPAYLVLEDGKTFEGYAIGAKGKAVGEVIFNTAMTGYQEILTDPSYCQQIITFSYPHIGNTGINLEDNESDKIWAAGVVVHDLCLHPSNYRSVMTLNNFLIQQNIVGISGVETRALVEHIRDHGTQKACILGKADYPAATHALANFPGLINKDLTAEVTTRKPYQYSTGKHHVVVYDYGVKKSILSLLESHNCRVTVVPSDWPVGQVLSLKPDGILLSNGPGDPYACHEAIANIKQLLGCDIPLFGICLGFQMLAIAAGCKTYKMKFGHHGANHPVMEINSSKVSISSQNHGFAVEAKSLPHDIKPTYISLFDQSLQGFCFTDKPIMGMQGHPEAGPGPHELNAIFTQFIEILEEQCQKELI